MASNSFSITFRGVRGGYPVPDPACAGVGGNTTCFEVRAGEHLVVVDAGTGIISLGRELMPCLQPEKPCLRMTLLFTHLHHDHTQGLPFFAPFRHPRAIIDIFGPQPPEASLEEEIKRILLPPAFPLNEQELLGQNTFRHVRGGEAILITEGGQAPQVIGAADPLKEPPQGGLLVSILYDSHHPRDGVLVYRFTYNKHSLVIATDSEGFVGGNQRVIAFAKEADVLVHDAEYEENEYTGPPLIRQGWGHSTWRMAVDTATQAGVKKLVLCHHNSGHTDTFLEGLLLKAQGVFKNSRLAREGETLTIG